VAGGVALSNPQPATRNPQPATRNPQPVTRNQQQPQSERSASVG
jgi:hypothetical protein